MQRLLDIFEKGGPVMWPILVLSIAAVAALVWAALTLHAGKRPARSLVFVSTVITAEPLLGILGTVTGIMQTFGSLDVSNASANPLAATAGIGEALITTAAGLLVSLILLFPYNLLDAKAEDGQA